jgi:hypothetical protein
VVAIGGLFVVLACGGGGTQTGAVDMPSPDDTTVSLEGQVVVQVQNNYGQAVVIYVSYGGNRRRLGQLNTNSVSNYVISWRSGGFWMVVESVLDNRTVRSNGLDVLSGSATRLVVTPTFTARLEPMPTGG